MQESATIFDPRQRRRQRDRAARDFAQHDFLLREVGARLADRLEDMAREFPRVLDLGCRTGQLRARVEGRKGVREVVECDLSPAMLAQATGDLRIAAEEEHLPFADESFDAVLSALSLQSVNDLPRAFAEAKRVLKPDGLFLAAFVGGESLRELRRALLDAELATAGGAAPRVSPMVEVRDAGQLLQRAGFALPVAESETITATYTDALSLMLDLRGMGEGNALLKRSRLPMKRAVLAATLAQYHAQFASADGRIPARFDIVTLTAWKPHASQQQPAARGSGRVDLREVFSPSPSSD